MLLNIYSFMRHNAVCQLPPGRAARIPLTISDLGIFRVAKTTTLISVKQLSLSYLQVALQLRGHWPLRITEYFLLNCEMLNWSAKETVISLETTY